MHFIILIPIILLFKLFLWIAGIGIFVSITKSIGEFLSKHIIPVFIVIISLSIYFGYVNNQSSSNQENYTYVEPPPPPKPDYIKNLENHKKNHKNILVCESLKVTHKNGEEVQFEISLRNKSKKNIKEYRGYLMVWDKNNKFINEYSFNEFDSYMHRSNSIRDGMRWDDKKQKYFDIKESDDWILSNHVDSFGFAYTDEEIKTYDFKKFKYLVCFSRIVFTDKTEYRENWWYNDAMENLKWIRAMADRLRDELSSEYDDETKDLIIRAFMQGLFQQPGIVEELKSSSLIESDYFEDAE